MKRVIITFILAVLIMCINSLYAQEFPTDKGSKLVFGSFAFSSAGGDLYENNDGDNMNTFQVAISSAFFVSPGFAIGPKFLYLSLSQGNDSYSTLGIGAHAVYFIGGGKKPDTIKGKALPYIGLSFTYQSMSESGWDESATGTIFSFGIGMMYMLSSKAGLMTEFGYQMDNIESTSGNRINLASGIAVFL